jgi:ubiquinone/menaquinone biosynthesis C-methylase UbiE
MGEPGSDWDRLAAVYPRQVRWEYAALKAAIELAQLRERDTLVDLGTGTGALLWEAAARIPRLRSAVGFDSSRGMLARVPPLPPMWAVKEADVRSLPLGDGVASVVTATYLLHLLDPAPVLAEARRVLAPGGRLVCVTPFARGPGAALLNAAARVSPGMRSLDTRPALAEAGFTVLRARTVRRGYPSLCVLAAR